MPKLAVQSHPLCTYTYHETDIHEFKYLQGNRESWDALMQLYTEVIEQVERDHTMRILIDATAGEPPLAYAASATRKWLKQNPDYPPSRTVVLYIDSPLLKIAETMTSALRVKNAQTRFFHHTRRTEAIEWLLSS